MIKIELGVIACCPLRSRNVLWDNLLQVSSHITPKSFSDSINDAPRPKIDDSFDLHRMTRLGWATVARNRGPAEQDTVLSVAAVQNTHFIVVPIKFRFEFSRHLFFVKKGYLWRGCETWCVIFLSLLITNTLNVHSKNEMNQRDRSICFRFEKRVMSTDSV